MGKPLQVKKSIRILCFSLVILGFFLFCLAMPVTPVCADIDSPTVVDSSIGSSDSGSGEGGSSDAGDSDSGSSGGGSSEASGESNSSDEGSGPVGSDGGAGSEEGGTDGNEGSTTEGINEETSEAEASTGNNPEDTETEGSDLESTEGRDVNIEDEGSSGEGPVPGSTDGAGDVIEEDGPNSEGTVEDAGDTNPLDNDLEDELIEEVAEGKIEETALKEEEEEFEVMGGVLPVFDITIHGTIYDTLTRQAIENATIELKSGDGSVTYTPAPFGDIILGNTYTYLFPKFSDLPVGSYTIKAGGQGYESYSWNFNIDTPTQVVIDGHTVGVPYIHDIDFYLAPTLREDQPGVSRPTGISGSWVSMNDEVVIDKDLIYPGYDLNIVAGTGIITNENPFKKVTINEGITITSRQIAPGGGDPDYLENPSNGNSGNINIKGSQVDIGKNVKILAQATDGFTAGDIKLIAYATGGTDILDILLANVDHPQATITVGEGATIKGKDITFDAKADTTVIFAENEEDEKTLSDTLYINTLLEKALGALEGFNLVGGVAVSQATSKIIVGKNSLIEADNFNAMATSIIKASASPTAIGAGVAVGVGITDAQVLILGKIITAEDCILKSLADNTLNVQGKSGGIAGLSAGIAVSILHSTSKVAVEPSAVLQIGRDLTLEAKTIDRNHTFARSITGKNGKVGVAIAVAQEYGETEAFLAGDIDVGRNITVKALMTNEGSQGIYAVAGANTDSSGTVTGDLSDKVKTAITSPIKNFVTKHIGDFFKRLLNKKDEVKEKTGSNVSSFEAAAATAVCIDTNHVTARILEDARIKSRGSVNVLAQAQTQPRILATGSAEEADENGNSSGGGGAANPDPDPGTGDEDNGTKFAGSAAIVIGIYENVVKAYIGERASVDAAQDLNIEAKYINDYELIYDIDLLTYLFGEFLSTSDGIQTVKKDDIIQVEDGHQAGGEAGNLYQYKGNSPLNTNLGNIDFSDEESWQNLGAEWQYRGNEFLKALGAHLNEDGLGLDEIGNFWVQSSAAGAKMSLCGTVSLIIRDNEVLAFIDKDARVNQKQDLVYRTGSQNVKVSSELVDEIIYFSGNIELPGFTFDKKNWKVQGNLGGFGTEAETVAAGGSLVIFIQNNSNKAEIKDNVRLFANNLDLTADTKVLNVVIGAAGGKSGKFGLEGTVNLIILSNETLATVANSARMVVPGKVIVTANDHTYLIDVAGVITQGGNIAVGGSVGINLVSRDTQAVIGVLENRPEGNKPSAGQLTIDASGDILVEASNDGFIISIGIAGVYSGESSGEGQGAGDGGGGAAPGGQEAPEGGGSYGVGVSAVVVANNMQDKVLAYIRQAALQSTNVVISARNRTKVIAVGGSVAIVNKSEDTSAALAGALAFNRIDNKTKAFIDKSDVLASGDIEIKADAGELIISLSASGSGATSSKSGSVAGQVSLNTIKSEVIAAIFNQSKVEGNNISLTANDSTMIIAVAGALAYGGKAGIGSAVAINDIPIEALGGDRNAVKAYIEGSDLSTNGNLTLGAEVTNLIMAVAAAVAASNEGMAAAASITVNTISVDTVAYIIGKQTTGINASGDISLGATDNSSIYSLAGAGTFSKDGYALGVAIAYNLINNVTQAFIGDIKKNKTTIVIAGNKLTLTALSQSTINNLAVGGGFASKFSGNGSISINTIINDIGAYIATSNILITSDISLTASDKSSIGAIAGALGASQKAAVGAALAINFMGVSDAVLGAHQVQVFINNSQLESVNGAISLKALSESIIKSISVAGGMAGKVAVNGAVSVNWIYTDVAAYIKDCSGADKGVKAKGKISLDAVDNNAVSVMAGDISGGGTVGAGASIAVVFIGAGGESLSQFINGLILNQAFADDEYPYDENGQNTSATYQGGVSDEDYKYPQPNFTKAGQVKTYIVNSKVTSENGSIKLTTTVNSAIFNISAGIAVGGKGGAYRGSLALNYINNEALARIDNSQVNAAQDLILIVSSEKREWLPQGALQVEWSNEEANTFNPGRELKDGEEPIKFSSIKAIAGGVSGGLNVGLGAALAVNHIQNNLAAQIINSTVTAGGTVKVSAESASGIETISAAIAAAFGDSATSFPVAAAGSFSLNSINSKVISNISGSRVSALNIEIVAQDTSYINSISGQIGISGGIIMVGPVPVPSGAAVGVAAAYNNINNTVKSSIDNNSNIRASNNLIIQAFSKSDIATIAAGGSFSGMVGISGTVALNMISGEVKAYIDNSSVSTGNNIYLLAQADSTTGSYGGSLGGGMIGTGAAAVVNIINKTTLAYISDAALIAKGNANAIRVLKWDEAGNESNEDAQGLIIIAHSRDKITVYTGALGVGGLGVGGEVAASSLNNTTQAYVTKSAINNASDWGKGVIIRAHEDTGIVVYAGAAAAGGTAVSGAVNVIDVGHITRAYIDNNSTIYALDAISLWASTNYGPLNGGNPNIIIGGASLGFSYALAGAVSVVTMHNVNEAFVNNSTLYSRGTINIDSIHNMKLSTITATATGGGFAGAGGSIFVNLIENQVRAYGENATLNAKGAIAIVAKSRDNIDIIVGTGSAGVVGGVAGAVSITLLENLTEAYFKGQINQDSEFKPGGLYAPAGTQTILILADNKTNIHNVDGAAGVGGLVGVGAVLDLISVQNRTIATIKNGSKVYAQGDITIKAIAEKNIDSAVFSAGGGGLFGLSGAISIITIGSSIDAASKDEFNTALLNQIISDTSLSNLFYTKNNKGEQVCLLPTYIDNTNAISSKFNNDSSKNAKINAVLNTTTNRSDRVTQAAVENAPGVGSRAEIISQGKVVIAALSTNNIKVRTNNAAIGVVAVAGGTFGKVIDADKTRAFLGSYAYVRAQNLAIKAEAVNRTKVLSQAASATLVVGTHAYVAEARVKPLVEAYIGNNADIAVTKEISIDADATPQVSTEVENIDLGGVGTIGASLAKSIVEPQVTAWIGDNVRALATISGNPTLTLLDKTELTGNPNLDFRGYTIRIEGDLVFTRGIAMSGNPDLIFSGSTITRKDNGSWLSDGFTADKTIIISGTRYNDGQYVIKSISGDGKVLTLQDNYHLQPETIDKKGMIKELNGEFVLESEIVTGEDNIARFKVTLQRDDNLSWEEAKVRLGDYIHIDIGSLIGGKLHGRIIEINGKQLILDMPGMLPVGETNISAITMELLPGEVMIRAAGNEGHDQIVFSDVRPIEGVSNSRGDKIAVGDYITIITIQNKENGYLLKLGMNLMRKLANGTQ